MSAVVFDVGETLVDETRVWGLHADRAGVTRLTFAYVGDRVDNDVVPANDAGMVSVFVRRGPWGALQAEWPEAEQAAVRIDSLVELPEALNGR